jgi:hypothetical protein
MPTQTHREPEATAEKVRRDVEHILGSRKAHRKTLARQVEDQVKGGATEVWKTLRGHPYFGTFATGAAVVALASAVGVGELALGGLAAYAAYKVFKGRERPARAFKEALSQAGKVP